MTKDAEWGPWIGWNGGECPVGLHQVVEGIFHNGDRVVQIKGIGDDFIWTEHPYMTIAYRANKEPVVEVRVQDAYFPGYGECADIQCTYTDGKLTKIHWEADQ